MADQPEDPQIKILAELWKTADSSTGITRVQALKEISRIEAERKLAGVLTKTNVEIKIRFVAPMVRDAE